MAGIAGIEPARLDLESGLPLSKSVPMKWQGRQGSNPLARTWKPGSLQEHPCEMEGAGGFEPPTSGLEPDVFPLNTRRL